MRASCRTTRSSTSRPTTFSGRCTSFRSRATGRRGGSTRTTSATSCCSSAAGSTIRRSTSRTRGGPRALLRPQGIFVLHDVKRALAALCVVVATAASVVPATAHATAASSYGVIALVDTGINPYNVVFRDRSALAQRYPGSYLPGYPKNVPALRLTLDAPSYADALRADCDRVWKHVKVGQLYWIPGTKIVGAISFNPSLEVACAGMASSVILDSAGHGTMTASRAVATG